MTFASLFLLWGREAWHTVNLLQEPVYLLAGLNFPLTVFKAWLPTALVGAFLLVPLAAGMDAMRQVLFRAPGVMSLETEIGLIAAMAVFFLAVARGTVRMLERKPKEKGD